MTTELFDRILAPEPPPFAILHRPEAAGADVLDVIVGEMSTPDTLASIPLPENETDGARHEVLAMVPFRQLTERGYTCHDDSEPLLAMKVTDQAVTGVADALRMLPDEPIELGGGHFDVDDDEYARIVRRVLAEEIGEGAGANFVIMRSFVVDISGYTPRCALSVFRRMMERESGAYWTYLVHTGDRTFVGATPERHVSLHDGVAVMNPISGTYRYPASGPDLDGLLDFLSDHKETEELYMVVDEELKMMSRICDGGARVIGPYLKEMAKLAHTEYFIEGRTGRDPRQILHETMFAPTVTGSPLENACNVIGRHEAHGRGYYSGIVALIGRDSRGGRAMDSSILIRSADIDRDGRAKIGVGATLVKHSDPASEIAETSAKAAGVLAALGIGDAPARFGDHPNVRAALDGRNELISRFWLAENGTGTQPMPALAGRRVLVVDAEDTFTAMLEHQLRALGLSVTVRRFDEAYSFDGYDLVVMGPGPGNPCDVTDPKIGHLRSAIGTLLDERKPFLAVCLSHQVLCRMLGFEVLRRAVPNQGSQAEIDLFGRPERVGFYNTFSARSPADKVDCSGVGRVEVSVDGQTDEVHALRGPGFASMQFHAESLLTQDGVRIVGERLAEALTPAVPTVPA